MPAGVTRACQLSATARKLSSLWLSLRQELDQAGRKDDAAHAFCFRSIHFWSVSAEQLCLPARQHDVSRHKQFLVRW